ncbi:hypothetical protein [Thioalkalivibrio sp. ALR17-21]|uniref:hypothetical protein n=1 Tax=Thioalkalivibrio sp. ALR17-21 TaxID=1269813 RepID=UPI00046263F1|nr:hypothetical protein [Thioalkalivibrio sp. ALR17-21]
MASLYSKLVRRPLGVLEELEGGVAEWLQGVGLLLVIVVLNTALSLLAGAKTPVEEFLEALQAAVSFSVLLAASVWVVLALVLGRTESPLKIHAASIIIMLPLILGPVPVMGLIAVLVTFGLIYVLLHQIARLSRGQAAGLMLLVWAIIAVVAVAYARLWA